jgi:hypothetical protein
MPLGAIAKARGLYQCWMLMVLVAKVMAGVGSCRAMESPSGRRRPSEHRHRDTTGLEYSDAAIVWAFCMAPFARVAFATSSSTSTSLKTEHEPVLLRKKVTPI